MALLKVALGVSFVLVICWRQTPSGEPKPFLHDGSHQATCSYVAPELQLADYYRNVSHETRSTGFEAAFHARCLGLQGGDRLLVQRDGRSTVVELYGIDCPETEQDFGMAAQQFVAGRVLGHTVKIEVRGRNRDGSLMGWVHVGHIVLNEQLVAAGLAWCRQDCPEEIVLPLLQDAARQDRRGLWRASHPTPPWEFRRSHRVRSVAALSPILTL